MGVYPFPVPLPLLLSPRFFSYGKMKIKQDSLAHSPFPDFWLSGPVLRVCDVKLMTSYGHSDMIE